MKRRNSIRLFSAMAAVQKGTTKTTSRKASKKLKQGTVFHDIERSQGHRQRHGQEYTRGVNAPPGHSNSHLLLFSTVEWSGISRSHEGTRTDGTRDCWRFVKVPSRARPLSTYFSRRTRTLPEENTKSLSGYLFAAQWLMTQISEKREPSPAVRGSSLEHFFVRST